MTQQFFLELYYNTVFKCFLFILLRGAMTLFCPSLSAGPSVCNVKIRGHRLRYFENNTKLA